jgi:hypothetical protein
LKHRFLELAQVAFWFDQEVENEFSGPGDPLKHRFLTSPNSHFCPAMMQKSSAQRLATP